MPIDPVALGERLKQARINCGLTQEQVAEHLEIPRTAVVGIEAGSRAVSTLELTKLATLYRQTVADLLNEAANEEDICVVLHRIDQDFVDDPNAKKEVSRHMEICREGSTLKDLLGIPTEDGPPEYSIAPPRSTMDAVEQGNLAAAQERRRLGLGNNPLPDLAKLIAAQGIWAAKAVLPDEMSGLFLHHHSIGLAILINKHHPRPRRRFSFAHEYAHALMDRRAAATVSTVSNRSDLIEVRANAFAASFLLPGEGVLAFLHHRRKALPSREEQIVYDPSASQASALVMARSRVSASSAKVAYQDVAAIKCYFGTSYQAACYRMKSLGLVSKDELQELLEKEEFADKAFVLADLKDDEPKDDDVLRLQVINLAIEAYRREEISQGRLREISSVLGISAAELVRLAEAA
jgi:Zn-dependent peptidase ImmA (M78 family)/transcriptional regulator with XRE-family HTH domain